MQTRRDGLFRVKSEVPRQGERPQPSDCLVGREREIFAELLDDVRIDAAVAKPAKGLVQPSPLGRG